MTLDKQHQEQISVLKSQIGRIESEVNEIDSAFKAHLEAYKQNNIALNGVIHEVKEMRRDMKEAHADLKPVLESYIAITKGRSMLVGLGSVFLALGAVGAGLIWFIRSIT